MKQIKRLFLLVFSVCHRHKWLMFRHDGQILRCCSRCGALEELRSYDTKIWNDAEAHTNSLSWQNIISIHEPTAREIVRLIETGAAWKISSVCHQGQKVELALERAADRYYWKVARLETS